MSPSSYGPFTHLPFILQTYFDKIKNDHKCVVLSPDIGSNKLSQAYAKKLKIGFALIDKRRNAHNQSEIAHLVGNLEDRHVLIIDDMIDTAGTVTKAVDALIDAGAKDVIIAATHAVLSGPAVDRLKKSRVSEVVVTNTLPIPEENRFDNLTVLSIAPLLGRAIREVFEDGSVTSLFDGHS